MTFEELRRVQFEKIKANICKGSFYSSPNDLVINEDSLNILKLIPDNSISLILTDPPYHSTKKNNITNDKSFATDELFIDWMSKFFKEWKRILKPNGSLFMYCSSAMSAKLEVKMSQDFNILSNIVWTKPNEPGFDGWKGKAKKESLRQWYPHSERIIFAEVAEEGNLKRSSFGHFLRNQRKIAGLSGNKLTEIVGAYGKVNHGGAVSNWEAGRNIPSREQYEKISKALLDTGKISSMPVYEDAIRKFDVNSNIEFTDVWNFSSVRPYKGKHPAEKPLDMLEHCILATTYEHDIVLDCFAGSGNTAIAAKNLNRKTISIDVEKQWCDSIINKLTNHQFFQMVYAEKIS
ncbi:DNA methyltransferase [Chryseobacterium sp. sg2396]|uniref:DNA methyltransferase n=1 Tax=Chryseobacterium sp. sg2396 TaxID=3276280 RepID=UPI00366D842E